MSLIFLALVVIVFSWYDGLYGLDMKTCFTCSVSLVISVIPSSIGKANILVWAELAGVVSSFRCKFLQIFTSLSTACVFLHLQLPTVLREHMIGNGLLHQREFEMQPSCPIYLIAGFPLCKAESRNVGVYLFPALVILLEFVSQASAYVYIHRSKAFNVHSRNEICA